MTAESVKFTIKDTGDVQKVEMKDDVTKVKISKQDIAGKELPGAKLTILDQDGKVVEQGTHDELIASGSTYSHMWDTYTRETIGEE